MLFFVFFFKFGFFVKVVLLFFVYLFGRWGKEKFLLGLILKWYLLCKIVCWCYFFFVLLLKYNFDGFINNGKKRILKL